MRVTVWLVLGALAAGGAEAGPPLVEKGEVFEDVELLLSGVSRRSPVNTVAFSPDGKTLVWGSDNGTTRLWDVASRTTVAILQSHSDKVLSVAFSADGKILAAGSDDGTVRLWDVASHAEVASLQGHTNWVLSVAFSADGRTLASGSVDGTVRLWDTANRNEVATLQGHTNWVRSVAFTADGKTLASGSADKTVRLWDVVSRTAVSTLQGHTSAVLSVAFSAAGRNLASSLADGTIWFWDVVSQTTVATPQGHKNKEFLDLDNATASAILSVAFTADGNTLVSGSAAGIVQLWDLTSHTAVATLAGHADPVRAVALSADGKTLASGSADGTVRLWDMVSRTAVATLQGHADLVRSVAFSTDGKTLASGQDDGTVRLWDVVSRTAVATLQTPTHVRRWTATSRDEVPSLQSYTNVVFSVAFNADGKILATGSLDGIVRLWDVARQTELANFQGHTLDVRTVAFSADGKILASGSDDGTVRLWHVASHAALATLQCHPRRVRTVAFSADSKTLATGLDDGTVRLWDVMSHTAVTTLQGHTKGVRAVAFSADGKILASGLDDGTVRLWEVPTRTAVATLQGHTNEVFFVAFSADGRTLATGSGDGTIRLWNVLSRTAVTTLQSPTSRVRSVAFSADGKTLATGSDDGIVRLWNVPTASVASFFLAGRGETWISCQLEGECLRHDDGTLLLLRAKDGSLKPIPPQEDLEPPQLEMAAKVIDELESADGEAKKFTLKIKNSGPHRAFWIRIRRAGEADDDPFVLHFPPTRSILEPGETIDLNVWVSTHTAYEHPRTQTATLNLEITSLYGEVIAIPPIRVRSKVPSLAWKKAHWDESGRSLTVELTNTGDEALPSVKVDARLSDVDKPFRSVNHRLLTPPSETMRVTLSSPEDFKPRDDTRVTITVCKTRAPVHVWNFRGQVIPSGKSPWAPAAALIALVLFVAAGLFLHPLVRKLSARPTELHTLSPKELSKARRLLWLTGRLSTVLAAAGIDPALLKRAIVFFADPEPASRFRLLAGRLGVELQRDGVEHAELLTLPFGADFPLNLNGALLHLPPAGRPAADVLARLRARPETRDQVTIVVATDPFRQEELHRLAGADLTNLQVIPSGAELTRVLLAADSATMLARIIASQVRLTRLSPYQTGGGVNKATVFFGRQDLLSHILNREPANYLLVGGRQLGKSSLLKAIDRHYRKDPRVRCCYLSLSGHDLSGGLARTFGLKRDAGLDRVMDHLSEGENRTLLLIDEADTFIRAADGASDILARLRSLSEEGRCHFILAGFWDLYDSAVLDYQSPLRNFGETLRISALDADACRELATRPMATMGLRYASDDLVDYLIFKTGQRANLIAIACNEILKNLGPVERLISPAVVENALDSLAVNDALEGWVDLGGEDKDGSRLDRILVYATIGRVNFSLEEALRLLAELGISVPDDRLQRSLRRLELAYILGREGTHYIYQVPLFVEKVRAHNPEALLANELARGR